MMNGKCDLHKVAWVLVIIGGLNWGLIGLLQLDVVQLVLGSWPMVIRVLYVLVGLSAIALCIGACGACKKAK